MKLGTANIRNFPDMTPAHVAQDARTVQENTSVCGLQEITPGEDSDVIRGVLRPHWRLYGAETTCPILVNTARWQVVDTAVQRHRRPDVGRPENPHHDVVSVRLASVKRPHLPPFAVVNTHLASGGYNAQHLPRVRALWDHEWDVTAEEVGRRRAEGLTVYLVGDLNNVRPPNLEPHRRWHWLSPQLSLDHVGEMVNPTSVQLVDHAHATHKLNSDHKLHVVTGRLTLG